MNDPALPEGGQWEGAPEDAHGIDDTKPQLIGGVLRAPASPKTKAKRRQLNKGHVHWDEQAIAEHDKERGTRQKIDEPDTPFVHSPQTASDSEGGFASSDDEHKGARSSQEVRASRAPKAPAERGTEDVAASQPPAQEVDLSVVGSRLDDWMRMGGNQRRTSNELVSAASSDVAEYAADGECSRPSSVCSSRSSSSAPPTRFAGDQRKQGGEARRIVLLPEDSSPPKQASENFRAKRAQHYNEIKALRAFKRNSTSTEESESDTSDEDVAATRTNTNTNINKSISKAVERRPSKEDRAARSVATVVAAAAAESCELRPVQAPLIGPCALPRSHPERPGGPAASDVASWDGASSSAQAAAAQASSRPPARGGAEARGVSFSGGESGGESTDEFRSQRRTHYQGEYQEARALNVVAGSLETNTNTNLNAGQGRGSDGIAKNPMEARRPLVSFGQGQQRSEGSPAGGAAAGGPPVVTVVGIGGSGDVDGNGSPAVGNADFRSRRRQHYAREANMARLLAAQNESSDTSEESSAESSRGARPAPAAPAQPESLANPMEPREASAPT